MTMNERTRRVVRWLMVASSLLCLIGAGVSGLLFQHLPMDMVLLQLVFYGAWACLSGAFVGGALGAGLEEDACGEMDMGITSSMGGILGTLATGLVGTALTGLAFFVPWQTVWLGAVAVEGVHLVVRWAWPYHLERRTEFDERGCRCDAAGRRLPDEQQPLRMRDRVAILLALGAAAMLALTLAMAVLMGSDLGHPVMMAPMMYGMFGTMLGGMLGGWLAGLLDEHRGAAEHENPVMVGAMALMAGMMGGMPSGMIGGMMAVMGTRAIGITVATGVGLVLLCWVLAVRGRYRFVRGGVPAAPRVDRRSVGPTVGGASLRVAGMTCSACVDKVQRAVSTVAGVSLVQVDLAGGAVHVQWSDGFGGMEQVRASIEGLGYEAGGS